MASVVQGAGGLRAGAYAGGHDLEHDNELVLHLHMYT